MSRLDKLVRCPKCYGYTPRDRTYCVYLCGYKLPEKELRGKIEDNNPLPPQGDVRYLPGGKK